MKTTARALLAALLPLLLSGCWDIKTIQDTNYITAVGYDYKDGQYVAYAQMVDFSNVTRQEEGKSGQTPVVWIGREQGESVVEAMTKLYRTAQQRIFWGHVSAIVFSEAALKHGISHFSDGLIRFREVRYTQWVYGTKQPIEQVLKVIPFFNETPIGSILHQPEDNYRQNSNIRPLRLQKVIADFREPGATLLLPSLGIAKGVWKENDEDSPKLLDDGIFVISKKSPLAWIAEDKLTGLHWIERDTRRADVKLTRDGEPVATISVADPKIKVKVRTDDSGAAIYSLRVGAKFSVSELAEDMDEAEIERIADETINAQIRETFAYADKKGLDLYQFEHVLYRQKFPAWSELTRNGEMPLRHIDLEAVEVRLKLVHSGMYKIKKNSGDY